MVCGKFLIVCCIVSLKAPSLSRGIPTGAPLSACESMMPKHAGVVPQSSAAPYIIKSEASVFETGKPVQVQIVGPRYQGFLLQARKDGSSSPLGEWQNPPENTQLLQCFGNPRSAVTCLNTSPRNNSITFVWVPPETACPTAVKFVYVLSCGAGKIWWVGFGFQIQGKSMASDIKAIRSTSHYRATVAQSYEIYWLNVQSHPLTKGEQ
ncbi:putative defense protein Hdd11-like [Pristis pectinata]|uniref:putative defense protein Hdd11-like n=1 Tax=Pristis pectinata TaxID=685728 RepID=UPI00223CC7FE|nr:putative defense protein Hdd11-like [Pristis pectinata]